MRLHLANLLVLTLLQGEMFAVFSFHNHENEDGAGISSYGGTDGKKYKAFLPPQTDELVNVKNRKTIQKRSTGRAVDIPPDVVERMAHIPVSALSTSLPEIQKIILDTHNELRRTAEPKAKNMLKMVWSPEAAKTAENCAKKCLPAHSVQGDRKIKNYNCGENIFHSDFLVPWDIAIKTWHSEKADFKYGYGPLSNQVTGHYTQLMWAPTHLIGCYLAECSNGPAKYNYVCHCCPAGNVGSVKNPWKQGESCGDCPAACDDDLCTNPCGYQDYFKGCENAKQRCATDSSMTTNCPGSCLCTKGEIK